MTSLKNKLFIGLAFGLISYLSGQPAHNDCQTPLLLPLNQWAAIQSNHQATINVEHLPPAVPYSCINTFENDLWFVFENNYQATPFQVVIIPLQCNTPAGVQAVLYDQYNCRDLQNHILACATKDFGDTVRLIAENPQNIQKAMIYVDGYDGTQCEFKIGVFAIPNFHPLDFCHYIRFDYAHPSNTYDFPFSIQQKNNQLHLVWEPSEQNILGYALQVKMKNGFKTLSCFQANEAVYQKKQPFQYIFNPDEMDNQTYCFRLLVYQQDKTYASQEECFTPKPITAFWVSPPQPTQNPNEFKYLYKIFKPAKAILELRDTEGKVIKQKSVKLTKGNYEDLISIEGLPKNRYIFKFCVENECFEYDLMAP